MKSKFINIIIFEENSIVYKLNIKKKIYKITFLSLYILAKIFDGAYGSELENKLESDLDLVREKRQRIGNAKYKWTNGRILLEHACNQLAFANKRWTDIKNTSL